MFLYRIAYVSASLAHSVVRSLAEQPVPGDEIVLDAHTVVTVREVIVHAEGGTIAADIVAETTDAAEEGALPGVTGSASRSSR